jgi:hypothetical protein
MAPGGDLNLVSLEQNAFGNTPAAGKKEATKVGGLSYSRHAENYRALFAKDAAHDPIAGSPSSALIQVKIHSPMSAAQYAASRRLCLGHAQAGIC